MWTVRILKEKFRHVNFLKYGFGWSEREIPNIFALRKVSLYLLCDESYLEDIVLPLNQKVFVSKFMAGSLSFDKRVFPWGYAEGEKDPFLKGGNGISLSSPVILWTNTSCCCSQGQLLKCCRKPCFFVCSFVFLFFVFNFCRPGKDWKKQNMRENWLCGMSSYGRKNWNNLPADSIARQLWERHGWAKTSVLSLRFCLNY